MEIGYARVSTEEQNLDLQIDALLKAGIGPDDIFVDKISGAKSKRVGLDLALKRLRQADRLSVWKLDRLGRDLRVLLEFQHTIAAMGVEFRSLTETFDIRTALGRFMFNSLGAHAQLERDLTIERTNAGVASAKTRGRVGGRRHYVQGERLVQMRRSLISGGDPKEIAATFGIAPRTLNNYFPGGRAGLLAQIISGENE